MLRNLTFPIHRRKHNHFRPLNLYLDVNILILDLLNLYRDVNILILDLLNLYIDVNILILDVLTLYIDVNILILDLLNLYIDVNILILDVLNLAGKLLPSSSIQTNRNRQRSLFYTYIILY